MRLSPAALSLVLALSCGGGCVAGTVTAPSPEGIVGADDPAETADPRDMFDAEVLPLVDARCGSCHVDQLGTPAFMAGDPYETMLAHPGLVVPGEPGASTLITRGAHTGPAWSSSEARAVSAWITLEGGEPPAGGPPMEEPPTDDPRSESATDPMPINSMRTHRIDLGPLGFPGAYFTFYATRDGDGVVLTDFAIGAGSTGLRIVHPRLYFHGGTGAPTPDDDRWVDLDLTIPPEDIRSLSTTVVAAGFPDPGAVSVDFATIAAR